MKREIFLLSAAMLLTGCGGKASPPQLDKAITMTADISYGGLEATARLERVADGEWTAKMLSPYALEGLTVAFDGSEASAEMNGIAAKFDVGGAASAISAVVGSLEAAIDGDGTECACADSVIVISGDGFSVTVSGDGLPVCLESGTVSAQFGDITVSDFCEAFDATLDE